MRRLMRTLALAAVALAACQTMDGFLHPMKLDLSNGTPLELALVVNGQVIDAHLGKGSHEFEGWQLPPLPWGVEVRSPGGRTLLTLLVQAGDVSTKTIPNGGTEMRGDGARVDLSCGRIDLYSGPPPLGPVPGPGVPGDCDG